MSNGRSIFSKLSLLCLFAAPGALAVDDVAPGDMSEPLVVEEPQFGDVLYYFYQEEYFPAIVRLLAARERQQLGENADEAELLLGGMYLSYGHHLEAAEIFEKLLSGNVAPDLRDRTWFFLAKVWYQRGYLEKAREALTYIKDELPQNLASEAKMLDAQIRIADGDYNAAIRRLSNWGDETEWASYARFNIGVALARSGRVDEAARLLNEIGAMDTYTEELAALRDKANLALGFALLQNGQPSDAKAPLQRVRLEGPFSNKALLGVGWADAEMENYDRALVPWMELRGRDLLDPAVQESMMAIPYAMSQLDSIGQAADHYVDAIEAFYEEANRLDSAIDNIESGAFFDAFIEGAPLDSTGWYWRPENLPEGPETRYLYHLLATNRFQEGLKNYRDLNYLNNNLDTWQQNVDVYTTMLETQKEKYARTFAYVRDQLTESDIRDFIAHKLGLDAVLNTILRRGDWLALSDEEEFELWREIALIENHPALNADIDEAREVRDKIDLMKGVLQWNLERDFNSRVTTVSYSLQETGEALIAAQRSRRKIDETMRTEPARYAALSERVGDLSPRVEAMKARVEDSLSQQRAFLRDIAVGELQAQKNRLEIYTIQARFALAAIYDLASTAEDEAGQ
ncbi:MAG: tetratricopeptide repeat protein [Gammaproteobacteria bacterium]|nr:tetratricopeptide repeat protein [Gammaproteobacteria bacterium]MBT8094422.1 tetratricopeptide repeat protein [Gammaproteobacteria bacterium]MBT8104761.1 tetratricopeptide repeat protein [Gammaproteobacteria bacterium]NNK24775.1 tetratricopeptide repeat protein [Woeseiaceae bacterium]NNL64302.1 tetratricopeptide repeat protein [Woeseiaceae bacterium]